ncbi:hypothetical protein FACS189459_6990 [Bacilli bacterium]|nr:hypothetical protein FACS189459_6990 [Bacilli bacterium]
MHDFGYIKLKNNKFNVINVIKGVNGQHFVNINTDGVEIHLNDVVSIIVDEKNRDKTSKNHSVEHILEYVLNKNISSSIKQAGAFKSSDYLTFDFNLPYKMSDEQIELVETKVNDMINEGIEVVTDLVTIDEAKDRGAVAHFSEVYSKIKGKLRLVCMGSLKEICGGTHVCNLKNIEMFVITKLISKGGGA